MKSLNVTVNVMFLRAKAALAFSVS